LSDGSLPMNDEFYLGWEDQAPVNIRRHVRQVVAGLLVLAVVLGIGFAIAQRAMGVAVFEWGNLKEFSGILRDEPYPHLLVSRPGARGGQERFSSYYLVKPFKFGFAREDFQGLVGKTVRLKGTLIYRGDQTMIEVVADSLVEVNPSESSPPGISPVPRESLGEQTLIGEIVDSKCYLGVMNPGALIPHRACAIRCLSGGIPPVLLVRTTNGPPLYFLLVSRRGQPVNREILDRVAEPVVVRGAVERQGSLLVLRADPAEIQRFNR